MRCRNCGAEIPEGQLICPFCRTAVQIVPDYNPLEDVLAREVKGSVEYATRPINSNDVRRYQSREERENEYATRVLRQGEYRSSTRVLSEGEMSRIRSQYTRTPSSSRYGGRNADRNEPAYRETGYVRRAQENAGQYYAPRNASADRGYARRNAPPDQGYVPGGAASDNRSVRRNAAWDTRYVPRDNPGGSGYARNTSGGSYYGGNAPGRNAYAGGGAQAGYTRAGSGLPGYTRTDMGYTVRGNMGGRGVSPQSRYPAGNVRRETGRMQRNTGNPGPEAEGRIPDGSEIRQEAGERQRQQKSAKRSSAKKRIRKLAAVFCMILVIGGAAGFVLYQNSYPGTLGKGQKSLQAGEYSAAENYFERAVKKNTKKAEAYSGLAKVYTQQKNLEKAEDVFITAIDSQPENAELYDAAIRFYMETEQQEKISPLLDGCDASVLSRVSDYVSAAPSFSIAEGTYQEVQEVALTGDGEIYYTDDGSTPTASSTPYKEPILLNVGTTVIKAVSINKKGIPSLTVTGSYTVELPIADAPAVTPSTGQYYAPFQITIQVPEGYTAYYTTDDSMPSAASEQYTGPIDMPQGSLIFSAVLVSDSGKMTSVTKRNYVLQME